MEPDTARRPRNIKEDALIALRLWPPAPAIRLPRRDPGRMAREMRAPNALREMRAEACEVRPKLIVRASTGKAG